MDEWQRNQEKKDLCQCESNTNTNNPTTTNPLTESHNTEETAAIKKKITEVIIKKKINELQISSHSDLV